MITYPCTYNQDSQNTTPQNNQDSQKRNLVAVRPVYISSSDPTGLYNSIHSTYIFQPYRSDTSMGKRKVNKHWSLTRGKSEHMKYI